MQSSRDGRKGVPPRQFLEADHLIQLGVWTTFAYQQRALVGAAMALASLNS
jgi:hypothetical protein